MVQLQKMELVGFNSGSDIGIFNFQVLASANYGEPKWPIFPVALLFGLVIGFVVGIIVALLSLLPQSLA